MSTVTAYTTSNYYDNNISNLLSKPFPNIRVKASCITLLPKPLTHKNAANPKLRVLIVEHCGELPEAVEMWFVKHNIKVDNYEQVCVDLYKEVLEIQTALYTGDRKKTDEELYDLGIKIQCWIILTRFIVKMHPTH